MKKKILVYVSIKLLVSFFLPSFASAEVCGQLAGVKGTGVEILRQQPERAGAERVRYGMRVQQQTAVSVECDDVVITGRDSSARIILANAKLSLGPDSRIEIAEHVGRRSPSAKPRVSLLALTYGKVRALVSKQKSANQESESPEKGAKSGKKSPQSPQVFRVRTFSAVVGVRGTDFFISYEPNSGLTEQATIEGLVEVQQSGTTQKVLVEPGRQVAVAITPAAAAMAQDPAREPIEVSREVAPLQVVPIQESIKNEIRVVSAVAREDRDFTHAQAVKTLGKPETWTMEREKLPKELEDIKNEF